MKRVLLVLLTIWAAAFFASCGSKNVTNVNPDFGRAGSFEVTTDEGLGTFTPAVEVSTDANGAVVTLSATDASDLAAAYMYLSYDASLYTPERVEFSEWLGSGDEVMTLSLTDKAGQVPVGAVQVASNGATPVNGNGLIATVHFKAEPFAGKSASATVAPTNDVNTVKDLSIIGQDASSVSLRWTESHPGDTDNNGEVNLADLTNVARYINETVTEAADPLAVSLADCNGDGVVTISELTTIGKNFSSVLNGYKLYMDEAGTQAYNNGELIERSFFWDSADPVKRNHPVVYVFNVLVDPTSQPKFVVSPANTSFPTAQTPLSNTAESVVVDGPPIAPSNPNAISGDLIGNGKIRLTWIPSPTGTPNEANPNDRGDVVSYEIERKAVAPETPFTRVATVPSTSASYVDSDAALSEQEYAYRVRAVDITGLTSDFSSEANGTPFFLPPPSPPQNVAAVTSATFGSSIDLTWQAPADNSAARFRIYRKGPADADFALARTTQNSSVLQLTDVNLEPLASYSYYLTSVSFNDTESSPSPTVTATASEEMDIQLISIGITNGKTTHHTGGGETATQITIVTNPAATSYTWGGGGTFTGSGDIVTWKPSASTPLGENTLTVTAVKGAKSVQGTVKVYVTSQTLKTQFGTAGKFIDFSDKASTKQANAPFRPFSYYADGEHVVLFNLWGTWCPPCRAELPEMHEWAVHYAGAYWHVGMNGPTESLATANAYFAAQNPPMTAFENYNPFDTNLWQKYGYTGSWPTTVLFDRDGNCRLQQVGMISGATAVLWNGTISDLTGMPEA